MTIINIKSQIAKSLELTPVCTGTHTTHLHVQEHTQVHVTCPKSFQNCDCLEQKINPNFKDSVTGRMGKLQVCRQEPVLVIMYLVTKQ